MKTLHSALMVVMSCAVLVVAVGLMPPWSLIAEAQHGEADDPQAHFEVVAKHLDLTADQQEAIGPSFHQAFAAMQELHRLHETIAAELTHEQRQKLAQMIHDAFSGSMSQEGHGQRHHGQGSH